MPSRGDKGASSSTTTDTEPSSASSGISDTEDDTNPGDSNMAGSSNISEDIPMQVNSVAAD